LLIMSKKKDMDDQDYLREEEDDGKKGWIAFNKALALLFVFALYFVIFLKILFLK
jgi:hypothetical protein